MNIYLILILAVLAGKFLLDLTVEIKNLKHLDPVLPEEFKRFYDDRTYEKSQRYTRVHTKFDMVQRAVSVTVLTVFILMGGFNLLDQWVRKFSFSPVLTGVIYIVLITLLSALLKLPFNVYSTFVIEEAFGFNRTTVKTFILDLMKGLVLSLILGVPLLAVVLWFFESAGPLAPLYIWIIVVLYQMFVTWIAPVLIMPVFNKFLPLGDGELKEKIVTYAGEQKFQMKGIYQMDGSKRSAKSNAFFTGFGKFRRIVLFDTLIKNHSTDELLVILAHEMGHYKKRHILKGMMLSILETGILLGMLSLFIKNPRLFDAFGMAHLSVYASLIFFGFLYTPVSVLLSLGARFISRRHEYQADRFAVKTTGLGKDFIMALKKLSVHNLSNLTPHPWKVFLDYSHPPVMDRIRAIREMN